MAWISECLLGSCTPFGSLYANIYFTFQLGCGRCNALFPYLLDDPILDWSINTYLFKLRPVVANPNKFFPSF